ELHLKDVRDRTFHYPRVSGEELRDGLASASEGQARYLEGSRPFKYADDIAERISFGDIGNPDDRKRFREIIETAKRIQESLIPVVWNALGVHLRSLGLDPHRLEAEGREDSTAETDETD